MKPRFELKVGIFMLVGLVLLGALMIAFSKGNTLFHRTYDIYLYSENVSGLKTRASVLMAGVEIGTVSDIRLTPDGKGVKITLRIYNQYPVHNDARFVIEQSGFLGDQYVSILPTKNAGLVFTDGGTATAEAPFNMLEAARSANGFLQRIEQTAKRLNDTIDRIDRLVLNDATLSNLSVSVSNFRVITEHAQKTVDQVNLLVASNTPALDGAVSNFVDFSAQLKGSATALRDVVGTNSPELTAAVKNLESSTETLKNLLADLKDGKGVAGGLLRNEQLATNVASIMQNLSITTSNLNRLGLWGILWQHKPPKTQPKASEPPSPAGANNSSN